MNIEGFSRLIKSFLFFEPKNVMGSKNQIWKDIMKRKFVGHIVSGKPVTIEESMKAGLIRDPEKKEVPVQTKAEFKKLMEKLNQNKSNNQ